MPRSVSRKTRKGAPEASQRFTASVSHEIRTPLNGILGMVSLLEETPLSPDQKDYVDAIRRSGSRLLDLLNNVLDYSRLEAGEMLLDMTPFDPGEVLQDVAELLAPRAHEAGLDLAAAPAPGLPSHYVGDAGRLRQILFNLAGNAIKFTEKGGVLLEVGQIADGLEFTVRDTGPGIPDSAKARIFDAFGQASASDAGRDSGVGLGLAIVSRLVDAMKGTVDVESVVGRGAAFRVRLPFAADPAAPSLQDARTPKKGVRVRVVAPFASDRAIRAALSGSAAFVAEGDAADVNIVDASQPPSVIEKSAREAPTLVILRPEDRAQIPKFRNMGCVGYLIRPLRAASVRERTGLAASGGVISERETACAPPGSRALIADDNPVNALLAKRALDAAGFVVDTVGTGAEALEAVTKAPYSIIFMDVRMPVMNGLEAARRIRALETDMASAPIIAVTADIDPDLESKAREAGVDLIASKPIDPMRLRELALQWAVKPAIA